MTRYSRTPPGHRPGLVLAAAIAALASTTLAFAQEEPVSEIIVTVRQRAEAIEDVPGSVTNFGTEQIQKLGIERARDFVNQTPGVSIVQTSAEVGDSQVNIRGINGARDAETNYALVIDGILMTNPSALNREYTNLESIQIFKGPQGAIYGRNAAAGAFIINTQEPGEDWSGQLKGSVAQDDTYLLTGNVGGAATDTLKLGFTGSYRDSEGYYNNAFADFEGRDTAIVDYFEQWDLGARAIWTPTDKLKVDSKFRYGEVDAASIAFNSVFHIPSLVGLLNQGFGFPADFAAFANENVNGHNFKFDNNVIPTNNQEATEFSIKVDYDLGFADLTAWGLYSNIENNLSADGTSGAFGFFFDEPRCQSTTADLNAAGYQLAPPQAIGPTPGFSVFGAYTATSCDGTQFQERNQKDYSFELRLASKSDQRLRWLGGLYFLDLRRDVAVNTGIDLDGSVAQTIYAGPGSNNPTEALVADRFDTNVYAVFGSVAYDLTDAIEASFALRYDREERDAASRVPTDAVTQFLDTCGDGGAGDPINPGLCFGTLDPQSETFDQWQPKFSLTWDALDNVTAYTSVGVGFKSGGFNNQGSAATVNVFTNTPLIYGTGDPDDPGSWDGAFSSFAPVGIEDQYREETSTAVELGVKANFLDNRLRTEAAVFYTDVDDMQFFEFFVGGFGLLRVVSNIDEVELKGFELSASFQATDWLSLFAGYALTDSEIEKNTVRPDSVGNKSPYTPDWTGNLGAQVNFPMTQTLSFVGGIDASLVGDTWFHVIQQDQRPTGFSAAFGIGPADYTIAQRDAYGVVNVRGGIQADNWRVQAFVTNLLDENYLEEVIPAPEFGGSFISPGTQRRVGVEATFSF